MAGNRSRSLTWISQQTITCQWNQNLGYASPTISPSTTPSNTLLSFSKRGMEKPWLLSSERMSSTIIQNVTAQLPLDEVQRLVRDAGNANSIKLQWEGPVVALWEEFETKIRPRIPILRTLLSLGDPQFVYFNRKLQARGPFRTAERSQREMGQVFIVTICVDYNSRFPRLLNFNADAEEAEEQVMESGEILIYQAHKTNVAYTTGDEGQRPTRTDVPEGQEGGYAVFAVYS